MRTRNQYHVYDLPENMPSHSAALVLQWLKEARATQPVPLQNVVNALCYGTSPNRPAVVPAAAPASASGGMHTTEARIHAMRGHLMSDASIAHAVRLFPQRDAAEATASLSQAVQADHAQWHAHVLTRMGKTDNLEEFCSLMAVYQGFDTLNAMLHSMHHTAAQSARSHRHPAAALAKAISKGELPTDMCEHLLTQCPLPLQKRLQQLASKPKQAPAPKQEDVMAEAVKTQGAFWRLLDDAASRLGRSKDSELHSILNPNMRWMNAVSLPTSLRQPALPSPEALDTLLAAMECHASKLNPAVWNQRLVDPLQGAKLVHGNYAEALRSTYDAAVAARGAYAQIKATDQGRAMAG